jgi:hypothetical protein
VEWVKEVERDSWASFKTTRSTAHAKQLLANLAACVVAWAAAVRHGGAGRGPAMEGRGEDQRGVVSGGRGRGRWRARGTERSGAGAAGAWEMASKGGRVTGAERNREEGWR